MLSYEELMDRLASKPLRPEGLNDMSSSERRTALTNLNNLFIPMDYMYAIYDTLYRAMLSSYSNLSLINMVAQQNDLFLGRQTKQFSTQAESCSILGVPGIGKTSTIRRCLHQIPQVIEHTEYRGEMLYCKQVLYLMVECPSDCSVKTLACSIFSALDQAMVNATNMGREDQIKLLEELRDVAHTEAKKIAGRLGGNEPLLVTTVKPEGTLSLLPTVSCGVHYSHSPYYIRRIRITATDPLCKVCEDLGYPVFPEVGQDPEDPRTKVIEFPVKAPAGKVKADVSAIEQLENYRMFMEHYVDHNASITVHVRENEWDDVEQWVWDNWDDVVALSFLSLDDNFYELMPYEEITEEEYERRKTTMKPFDPSLLSRYEKAESELDIGDSECVNGVCPVR